MKKLLLTMTLFLMLTGCATQNGTLPGASGDLAEKPDAFCQVIQEPDPLLMGEWTTTFTRYDETGVPDSSSVKYRLVRVGDQYAVFFHRVFRGGRKVRSGWRNWTINGKQIEGEPKFGVRIFVEGNDVYLTLRGMDEPAKMTRVGNP